MKWATATTTTTASNKRVHKLVSPYDGNLGLESVEGFFIFIFYYFIILAKMQFYIGLVNNKQYLDMKYLTQMEYPHVFFFITYWALGPHYSITQVGPLEDIA
jgi:hypothetical protein